MFFKCFTASAHLFVEVSDGDCVCVRVRVLMCILYTLLFIQFVCLCVVATGTGAVSFLYFLVLQFVGRYSPLLLSICLYFVSLTTFANDDNDNVDDIDYN